MRREYVVFLNILYSAICYKKMLVTVELSTSLSYSKQADFDESKFPDVERLFNVSGGTVRRLVVKNSKITTIDQKLLAKLINLNTLEVVHNKHLNRIEANAFSRNTKITSLSLSHNSISFISPQALNGLFQRSSQRGVFRLDGNNIRKLPRFNGSFPGLEKLTLDNNPLERFRPRQFSGMSSLYFLTASKTYLQRIEGNTFRECPHLHTIVLSHNGRLSVLEDDAFAGINVQTLDLSGNPLSTLPAQGLETLHTLHIADMTSLHHIPDAIVGVKTLKSVQVDEQKRYLCCAFDNRRARLQTLYNQKKVTPSATLCPTPQTPAAKRERKYKRTTRQKNYSKENVRQRNSKIRRRESGPSKVNNFDDFVSGGGGGGGFDSGGQLATHPPNGSTICGKQEGEVHVDEYVEVECTPAPDPLRPCDDILGDTGLTLLSWCVAIVGLVANAFVFVIVSFSRRTSTVTKFLLQNLSLADLSLSLYLFVLVCASSSTSGSYYNYVRKWQHGGGCAVEGFLAMFSSQLSVLVLFVITIERYFSIVHALKFKLRFSILKARWCIVVSWLLSLIVAFLPIIGINSYTDVAICLPFRTSGYADRIYIGVVMTSNVVLFIGVLVSYLRMYWRIRNPAIHPKDGGRLDSDIAKRMAMLVFTDFACWIPIAFVALVSTFVGPGVLDMDMSKSKYLLVIFFPINSICNPILYAVTTKTFKKDLKEVIGKRCPLLCTNSIGLDQQDDKNTRSRRLTSLSGLYQGIYKRISSKFSKDEFTKVRIPLLARRFPEMEDEKPSSVPVSRREMNNLKNMIQFLKLVNESEERLRLEETYGSEMRCSNTHVIGQIDTNHCHVTQCSTDRADPNKLPLVRVRSNSTGRINRGSISPAFREITIDYDFSTETFMMAKETCGL